MKFSKRHIWPLVILLICLVICSTILYYLFVGLHKGNDFVIKLNEKIEIEETGQIGDFIGGVVGTIVSLCALILVLLTYINQRDTNEKNMIDAKFLNLISIHKSNVVEMEYMNPYKGQEDSPRQEENNESKKS